MPSRPALAAAVLASTLALAACSSRPEASSGASSDAPSSDDHGEVAGAAELAEPALALTTIDAAGAVRHLDLLDESVTGIGDVDAPRAVHTDGRFAYVETATGVEVVDSGVWTWDHVDHFHYYRAEPREVGAVVGTGPVGVATTASSTSGGAGLFFAGSGEAVRLDVAALAEGEVVEEYRVPGVPHDGLLVPVGDHALVTEADTPGGPAQRLAVLDDAGEPTGETHPCPRASGTTTTRVGTVVGCADGARLVRLEDDDLVVEAVPLPAGTTAAPALGFAGRDGRPTVAGLAGPEGRDGVWLLDTRARAWSLLPTPAPLAAVSAVDDDDEHVLGLTAAGRVLVLDGATGEELARSRPLAARSLRTGTGTPTLVIDQQRAYLSAPAEQRLHEIDFADGARVSRSFTTSTPPLLLAGTGR